MAQRIVILGGGTGGTLLANRLRRRLAEDAAAITVVDRDDAHVYQPGLLFVPFGLADADRIVRSRRAQLRRGVDFRLGDVDHVALDDQRVHLADGAVLDYDVLVVASGARLQPEETDGLTGAGWGERTFSFYDRDGARALSRALDGLADGRLVVDVVDMPIKCPVAPLEFCFLADWWLRERGRRHRVELAFVTPLDAAFTKPICSERLAGMLADRGIELVADFAAGEVHGEEGRLVSYDGREEPFDLLVAVPAHGGAEFVERSPGLGDELGYVPTDMATLQSRVRPNVFAIGDATDLPISKAGSVAHFEGEVLAENIERFLAGAELLTAYDGHANCFIEAGDGRALLIDFNHETEPLPGRYPTRFGPLPLLRESRLNHRAKLLFDWVYWNVLLPGRAIPGIGPQMPTAGKLPAAGRPEREDMHDHVR